MPIRTAIEQRSLLLDARHRPPRRIPVSGECGQDAGFDKQGALAPIHTRSTAEIFGIGEAGLAACDFNPLRRVLRKPRTSRSPRRMAGYRGSAFSSVLSQPLVNTSTGRTSTPCRRTSWVIWLVE